MPGREPYCPRLALYTFRLLAFSKYPTGGSGGVKPPGGRFQDERFWQRHGKALHTPEAADLYAAG